MHKPRKRFGQNFLIDENICHKIADLPYQGPVIEIGPGQGAITRLLLEAHPVTAIEIDRDLAEILSRLFTDANFTLLNEDILDVNFNQFAKPLNVVGNLPYNITSPILFHLFKYRGDIGHMRFMVQREVAERMMSAHGSKQYGRLTVMVQACFDVHHVTDVSPQCFDPPPAVVSTVIDLVPKATMPDDETYAHLEDIARTAFSQRRKQLKNTLGKRFTMAKISEAGIDWLQRPEQVSPEDFLKLAALHK